jgi:sortase (surface protein transpeptidase)
VESKVFSLFQISLENFFKTKFYLGLHLHIQPSEIDQLEYYEYWYYVQNLKDHLDKKNKAQKDQEQAQSEKYSTSKYTNPKVPSMNMPSVKMPKI